MYRYLKVTRFRTFGGEGRAGGQEDQKWAQNSPRTAGPFCGGEHHLTNRKTLSKMLAAIFSASLLFKTA